MNKEYLTIKEFADLKGVSVSSVYKRLKTSLQPFLEEVEGKKVLNIKVLEHEGLKSFNDEVEAVSTSTANPSSTSSSTFFFEKQIEEKDKQIEFLNNQIKELQESNKKKDDYIQEQGRKMTELLEQSNILLKNNQILLSDKASDIKEKEVVEEVIPRAVVNKEETEEQPEKKSWFKRLFG